MIRKQLAPAERWAVRRMVPFGGAAVLLLTGGLLAAGNAAQVDGAKQTICHGTASDTNPYEMNEPAADGDLNGHAGHTGPVWNPTLKADHIAWGDIIPPFTYLVGDVETAFPGLNWTAEGQAIYAAGCVLPELTPTPTPSITPSETPSPTPTIDVSETPSPTPTIVVTETPSPTTAVSETPSPTPTESLSPTPTLSETPSPTPTSDVLPTTATTVSLVAVKTNDANGDGVYSAEETAPNAGADVPFRVVVTNTGGATIALDGLTDAIGGAAPFAVSCDLPLPAQLAPASSATCDFVVTAGSPAAGASVKDLASVTGHDAADPARPVGATATSVVDGFAGGQGTEGALPPATSPGDLAFTGSPTEDWVLTGAALLLSGAMMLALARRRRTS